MDRIIRLVFDVVLVRILQLIGVALILSILTQILSRYVMLRPFPWTEELARFSFIWFCFLGSAYTLRKDMHLGIDYYYLKFNPTGRLVIDFFVTTLILAFGGFMVIFGLRMVGVTAIQQSTIMRIPMSYMYAVLPITGSLFVIVCGQQYAQLVQRVQNSAGGAQ